MEFTATAKGLLPAGTVANVTWATADGNVTARLTNRRTNWKLRARCMGSSREIVPEVVVAVSGVVLRSDATPIRKPEISSGAVNAKTLLEARSLHPCL